MTSGYGRVWVLALAALLGACQGYVEAGSATSNGANETSGDRYRPYLNSQQYDAVVQELGQLPFLPWRYTADGCHARALYFSMALAAEGIATRHAYTVAQGTFRIGAGNCPAGQPLCAPGEVDGCCITWGWHVAPVVSKDGINDQLWLLDPLFGQTQALTLQQWITAQDANLTAANTAAELYVLTVPGSAFPHGYPANPQGIGWSAQPLMVNDSAHPAAQVHREPTFSQMPPFELADINAACELMRRYIDRESGTSAQERAAKKAALVSFTQSTIATLRQLQKISGTTPLSPDCLGSDATPPSGPDAGKGADAGSGAAPTPTPKPTPAPPTACYYGGQVGTCQAVGAPCSGTTRPSLCPNGQTPSCCLPKSSPTPPPPSPTPPPGPSYGSCTANGQTGTCQATSTYCSGSYVANKCPGDATIKCCVPSAAPPPNYGSCSANGKKGTCQSTSVACSGGYVANLCPGDATIKCCLP